MPVTIRHQVSNDNHIPFVFKKLETPPRRPRKQPCVEDAKSTQTQKTNVQHNFLYTFENPFGTPFETPKGGNSLITMVHPDEVRRRLKEKVCEN